MANDQDKTGQQGGTAQTISAASRTIHNGHLSQDKEGDRCRAGSPTWTDNVITREAARAQAATTKVINREQVVQLIKAGRVAMPLGQNPTMTRATLTKLRKRYKTKTAA
ncbi:hypothetical protein N5D52_28960 [Pseudomonas sp. GD03860]|uniref:hypothetical protein n=1 Tax=Pseudomonas TaxID=286 RepID=UPI00236349FA|nr:MULTISPECIES: hypothetical protein [Pseudomonas]MDD2059104.1 hypothetical protein [Pseudomonas putida]MDH0640959.1 hypothetical protein [Pseudomonas sp. GD03860]